MNLLYEALRPKNDLIIANCGSVFGQIHITDVPEIYSIYVQNGSEYHRLWNLLISMIFKISTTISIIWWTIKLIYPINVQ